MSADKFLWGAATSAHQVEGENYNNDWWQWEKASPTRVASGKACDHYNRYQADFALAKKLGHNAHRLSVEWSRIEPNQGQWNRPATDHYRQVLQELRRQNMKIFLTTHHFTNPVWLAKQGGWTNRAAPELFEKYIDYLAQHLGDLVDYWVTLNEPMVYATQSYWRGIWPPQKQSLSDLLKVVGFMARAHRLAYRRLHRRLPGAQVGMAKHFISYVPAREKNLGDRVLTAAADWWFNQRWYGLTGPSHDFIGVNYYFTQTVRLRLSPFGVETIPWQGERSDLGWPINPAGLTQVLISARRYQLPIFVTENGLADAADTKRGDFIRSHLRAIEKAQMQGANVRGYFHWSLLDNFEWADGFQPRFGLVEVDYKTMQRRIRPSAYVYEAIIRQAQKK